MFENIDKTKISTGYLRDFAFELVDFDLFNGEELTDSNRVDSGILEMMLRSIRSAAVGDKPFNSASDELLNMIGDNEVIPIASMIYKYEYIVENAIEQGLIVVENDRAYDAYSSTGAWQNPYSQAYLVGAAPLADISYNALVTYSFEEMFTNVYISNIQFDPGDGYGFRTLSQGSILNVNYGSSGLYDLTFRITLNTGVVLHTHSSITVVVPIPETKAPISDIVESIDTLGCSAEMSILYNTTTNSINKPIIVVEGFNFKFPTLDNALHNMNVNVPGSLSSETCAEKYFESIPSYLKSNYDFIYIDWNESKADLFLNAAVLQKVIETVNNMKHATGSEEKNIIIGESMGGIIARIALRQMELSGKTHQTKTYVSYDSPHLGANVPLGLLYLFNDVCTFWYDRLADKRWLDCFSNKNYISNVSNIVDELYDLAHSTSVKQMLVNYVNENGILDNSIHENFLSQLRQIGFPEGDPGCPIDNMAICKSGSYKKSYLSEDKLFYMDENLLEGFYAYGAYLLLEGVSALIPAIGRKCNLHIKIGAYPLVANNSKIAELSLVYNKTKLIGNRTKSFTIFDTNHMSPSNAICYDGVPSSFVNLNIDNSSLSNNYNSLFIDDEFAFIPTASALCYNYGNSLTAADYAKDFCINMPSFPNQIPFSALKLTSAKDYHWFGSCPYDDIDWVLSQSSKQMGGPSATKTGDLYFITNCTEPVSWYSSDTSVATIDQNGRITVISAGFTTIRAAIHEGMVNRIITKRIMVGFPDFTLSHKQFIPAFGNAAKISISATPSSYEFYDFVNSTGVKYHWGLLPSGSSTISWSVSDLSSISLNKISNVMYTDVYFYVENDAGVSTTYTTRVYHQVQTPGITPWPGLGPLVVNSEGQLINTTDFICEEEVQTKSQDADRLTLKIKEENISLFFDGYPSQKELLDRLSENENFKAMIRQLKPWGDNTLLIRVMTLSDSANGVLAEIPLMIVYKEDF